MDLDLQDRVVIVTGATSGLGRAVADTLVGEGACVVVAARTAADVAAVAAELGDAAIGVPVDLTDPAAPHRLVSAARDRWGRLDGAFVSHGGPPASSALDLDDDLLAQSLELAAVGPIRLLRELARTVEAGASLVVLTSVSSVEPIAGIAGSNVARPAVWAYAKHMADEVGPRGVRVNAILPGRFATDRLVDLWETRAAANGTSVEEERAADEAAIPLRRIGDPVELGALAAFLLSPRSGYLHGAAVRMDGGSVRGL
jgi:3-oxoacyl-[acyl-carrier protein] reductase